MIDFVGAMEFYPETACLLAWQIVATKEHRVTPWMAKRREICKCTADGHRLHAHASHTEHVVHHKEGHVTLDALNLTQAELQKLDSIVATDIKLYKHALKDFLGIRLLPPTSYLLPPTSSSSSSSSSSSPPTSCGEHAPPFCQNSITLAKLSISSHALPLPAGPIRVQGASNRSRPRSGTAFCATRRSRKRRPRSGT